MIYRNLTLADEVLESEEAIDDFRDQIFEYLPSAMNRDSSLVPIHVQYMLATRNMERVADHTTNIAEDIVFWLRGLVIRHRRPNSFSINSSKSGAE
ncbi:MAG: PhoU domain-containing protein [Candidatus Acidiferrales bacterium]